MYARTTTSESQPIEGEERYGTQFNEAWSIWGDREEEEEKEKLAEGVHLQQEPESSQEPPLDVAARRRLRDAAIRSRKAAALADVEAEVAALHLQVQDLEDQRTVLHAKNEGLERIDPKHQLLTTLVSQIVLYTSSFEDLVLAEVDWSDEGVARATLCARMTITTLKKNSRSSLREKNQVLWV